MTRTPHADSKTPALSTWRRYLQRIAYAREYVWLAVLFVMVVAGLSLVTFAGVQVLSAVRAYTNAEALYSKAQKDAVYYLHQYASSGKEEHFEKYRHAIAVPLGYRQARVELEKSDPNPEVIRQGMLQGRLHPEDAEASVWAYRLVRRVGPVRRAIRVWSEADLLVAQLQIVAELLHNEVTAGSPAPARVAELLQEIERLNLNLTTLEESFSGTMGEVGRWVQGFVLVTMLSAALALLGLGLVPSWRILSRLKNSREKYRRLFEQSRDAIIFVTLEGDVAYANPAAFQLFGYPPDAYNQQSFDPVPIRTFFVHDAERKEMRAALDEHGFVQNVEVQLRRRDGAMIDGLITSTLIRDRHDKPIGFETILRDITARKRTERRMRLLERAVEASGNVILVSDATRPDFPLVYVNPAFERLTGFTPDEAIGRDGFFLLSSDTNPEGLKVDLLKRTLRNGSESRVVVHNQRRDGTPFWSEICFTPVFDDKGTLINYVGIQVDITESKQAEATLKKALEKERELSELQARFVSMASHEFRTPLSAILSSSELVERFRHKWDAERIEKHLHRIQTNVHHLINLLENVLVIGRVEAGRLGFSPERFDLRTFFREMIEETGLRHNADHPLELDLPDVPLEAMADPNLLRYILTNLLTNAAKYSAPGTPIQLSMHTAQGQVHFRVVDQGIGIPGEDLPHIFEPFHRGANAETIPGTGLGLSIVQRAVELHHGTVTIESEEGHGTAVEISIPLAIRQTPAPATL